MNTMHLIGAEEVASAGRNMSGAADRMQAAAATMDAAAETLRAVMVEATEAINRLNETLAKTLPPEPESMPGKIKCAHDNTLCPTPAVCTSDWTCARLVKDHWECKRAYGPTCADKSICKERGSCTR